MTRLKTENFISLHYPVPPIKSEFVYFEKEKQYTEEEYIELMRTRRLIKELINDVIKFSALMVFAGFRAYVFYEYGV